MWGTVGLHVAMAQLTDPSRQASRKVVQQVGGVEMLRPRRWRQRCPWYERLSWDPRFVGATCFGVRRRHPVHLTQTLRFCSTQLGDHAKVALSYIWSRKSAPTPKGRESVGSWTAKTATEVSGLPFVGGVLQYVRQTAEGTVSLTPWGPHGVAFTGGVKAGVLLPYGSAWGKPSCITGEGRWLHPREGQATCVFHDITNLLLPLGCCIQPDDVRCLPALPSHALVLSAHVGGSPLAVQALSASAASHALTPSALVAAPERMFLGGTRTIRGFDTGGAGPTDARRASGAQAKTSSWWPQSSRTADSVGADLAWCARLAALFPLRTSEAGRPGRVVAMHGEVKMHASYDASECQHVSFISLSYAPCMLLLLLPALLTPRTPDFLCPIRSRSCSGPRVPPHPLRASVHGRGQLGALAVGPRVRRGGGRAGHAARAGVVVAGERRGGPGAEDGGWEHRGEHLQGPAGGPGRRGLLLRPLPGPRGRGVRVSWAGTSGVLAIGWVCQVERWRVGG